MFNDDDVTIISVCACVFYVSSQQFESDNKNKSNN